MSQLTGTVRGNTGGITNWFTGNPSGELMYSIYIPDSVVVRALTVNLCQPETTFDTYIW